MSFSNYLEEKLLGHVFGSVDYTPPTSITVHLYTATPNDSGGGTEVSTGVWTNYAAVSLPNNTTSFNPASGGEVSNGVEVNFGTAAITGTAPVVTHIGLKDQSGNLLGYGALSSSKTINHGDSVYFPTESLFVYLD